MNRFFTVIAFLTTVSFFGLTASMKQVVVSDNEPFLECLTKNVYFESRGEPIKGQIAVAYVTWERANRTVEQLCEVVYQPKQFSWTSTKAVVNDPEAYAKAHQIATAVVNGEVDNPVPDALYFHAARIKPYWSNKKNVVAPIGNHVFYKKI